MNHPAELAVHQFFETVSKRRGEAVMSEETIEQVVNDVREALTKQFGNKAANNRFKIRMSNVGKAPCQLWFEKNKPEEALPLPTTFVMNMMIGDIVEAVFKGVLKEAGVDYKDSEHVTLQLSDGSEISGTYDLVIDGKVDDVKSASNWSYKNKFASYETLEESDPFGYIGQLAGYAKAANLEAGGWWVINKATGEFKYVPSNIDIESKISHIEDTVQKVTSNTFERCYEAEDETFRSKPTGNKVLCKECSFCSYRFSCWDGLKEIPSLVSQAKEPKIVSYVYIDKESMKNGYRS